MTDFATESCGEAIVQAAETDEPGAVVRLLGIRAVYSDGTALQNGECPPGSSIDCPLRQCDKTIGFVVVAGHVIRDEAGDNTARCKRSSAPATIRFED